MGLRAATAGIDFMPSHAWVGTDLPALRPDVQTITDPYSGEPLTAFPRIELDVAVLHALEADRHGNVKLNNNLAIDLELVYTAKTVIVTFERWVEQVEKSADGMVIPAPGADIIALAPRGAWPTSCYPLYPVGGGELMRYIDACNAGAFAHYLATFVQGSG
jgi:glutaconate CoA-transferase subunit A